MPDQLKVSKIINEIYLLMPAAPTIRYRLADAIIATIASGALGKNDNMPTLNEISDATGIGMNTVHSAYKICGEIGIITLQRGKAAVVEVASEEVLKDSIENAKTSMTKIVEALNVLNVSFEEMKNMLDDIQKNLRKPGKKKTSKTKTPS